MYASGKKGSSLAGGLGPAGSYSKATFFAATQLVTSTWTKLPFAGEAYDNLNEIDTVTNKRWTATEDGFYKITAVASVQSMLVATGKGCVLRLYKNGASQYERSPAGIELSPSVEGIAVIMQTTTLELNAGDYIELFAWQNAGSTKQITSQNNYCTFERIA